MRGTSERNSFGRKQSPGAHETVRAARCSDVFAIAENNRGPSTRQTDPTVGTSVGANYRGARSRPEFIAKCGDSLRELEETAYWLEMLIDGKIVLPELLTDYNRNVTN